MSNSIAPGSSADVNVKVTALTTNPNVPAQYKTIILKKNLVNGVNTLTQEMISTTNTKYVVKYDYVLGEDITIPANCVLEFDGGSINGSNKVTLQNTFLSGIPKILCDFDGHISNGEIDITWFGISPSANSQQVKFQKVVDLYEDNVHPTSSWDMHMRNPEPKIIIPNGIYNFGTINLRSYIHIEGAGRGNTELQNTTFKLEGAYNFHLSNFTMSGPESQEIDTTIDIDDVLDGATATGVKDFLQDYSIGIYMIGSARFIIDNVCVQKYNIGICGDEAYSGELYSSYISYCTIGYLNYGYNTGHAGHNIHYIGGEIANFKYGFVQNYGSSVVIENSAIEAGTYAVYIRYAGHINIENNYFEANDYDIYGNLRQTKIVNNFFSNVHKSENGYYIYILSCQADLISGNVFGTKTNNNHIGVADTSEIYRQPYIRCNFVIGSNPLTVDNGLHVNFDFGGFVSSYGEVEFTEARNSVFTSTRLLGVTSSNGDTRYLRGLVSDKATLPISIGEWDLGSAENSLDSECEGLDVFFKYNKRPAWFNGTKFVDANGYTMARLKNRGTYANRPTQLTSDDEGFMYFATDKGSNGKPIWWSGSTWIYADGTIVS